MSNWMNFRNFFSAIALTTTVLTIVHYAAYEIALPAFGLFLLATITTMAYTEPHKQIIDPSRLKSVFSLNPEKELLRQPPLWLSIIFPLYLFLGFGFFFWNGHKVDLSEEGFKYFIQISQLPLWLLTTLAPLTILVARAHATAQTAHQIQRLESKNNLDHYFTNRREFNNTIEKTKAKFNKIDYISSKLISLTNQSNNLQLTPSTMLHDTFTNGSAEDGITGINKQEIAVIRDNINEIADAIIHTYWNKPSDISIMKSLVTCKKSITIIQNRIRCDHINIIIKGSNDVTLHFDKKTHKIQRLDLQDFYTILTLASTYMNTIANFYGHRPEHVNFYNFPKLESLINMTNTKNWSGFDIHNFMSRNDKTPFGIEQ